MPLRRRQNASFAWDILRSDVKLLLYPVLRIVLAIALLAAMWPLIFDISAMDVAHSMGDLTNDAIATSAIQDQNPDGYQQDAQYTQDTSRAQHDLTNVLSHMHFGWFLLFIVINVFIGIFSVGALTAQALATVRGDEKSFFYGYAMALIRLPQLLLWWLVTVIIGAILHAIERHRALGMIVAVVLGLVWSILTFFSITTIMATGCGPWGAIKNSKKTIQDAWHKITGVAGGDLRTIRRGFYVGGPFALINLLLVLALIGMGWFDMRSFTHGGHHISLGAFGAIIVMLYISGAFMSAMWAVVKATIYVWAEEDTLPEGVDASVMQGAFYQRGAAASMISSL